MIPPPEYLRRLLLGAACGAIEVASVADVVIEHSRRCGIHRRRACNCDPVITLQADGRTVELQADGSVRDLGACQ